MLKKLPCILAVILLLSWGFLFLQMHKPLIQSPPIDLSLEILRLGTNECVLKLTIVNNEKENLVFDEEDLPWHIVGENLTIALIEEDHNLRKPIERSPSVMGNPRVSLPVTVRAGEARSEELHLNGYYEDLLPALLRHDVTMLWAYHPHPKVERNYKPVVGLLRFPQIK